VFSARFGAPLLLVFLGLGILAGKEGPGGLLFRDFQAAYLIGSIAFAIILSRRRPSNELI
jgi:potassium/hydrogen antiporter